MVSYRNTRDALRALTAIAADQGGYFTAKQAQHAGYDYPHLEYHLKARNFQRIGHGLYRLPAFPQSDHDDLIRFSLWSRNRDDEPQAVVSHESALVLHELSEVLPGWTHLTVPPTFRKQPPRGCVLHKTPRGAPEVEKREGFRVTSPIRTLLDSAATISQEQLAKAVGEAIARGLVRTKTFLKAIERHQYYERLAHAFAAHHNPV